MFYVAYARTPSKGVAPQTRAGNRGVTPQTNAATSRPTLIRRQATPASARFNRNR